jgi:hypothetical protein
MMFGTSTIGVRFFDTGDVLPAARSSGERSAKNSTSEAM